MKKKWILILGVFLEVLQGFLFSYGTENTQNDKHSPYDP